MKNILFFVIFTLFGGSIWAQEEPAIQFGGKTYFYNEFQLGTVYFKDGTISKAMMNYNFVLQKMQFLNHQNENEVLDLIYSPDMKYVKIKNDFFYPLEDKGFAFVVLDGYVALLQKRHVVKKKAITGPFGTSNQNVSIDEIRAGSAFGDLDVIASKESALKTNAHIEIVYYLMKDKKIYPATKRNYLKLYPKIKPEIKKFLSEHKVDFEKYEDLRGFSKFCNSLMLAK